VIVGACLLFLLIYSMATVFVRRTWTLQSFQIGVFALLAVYLVAGIREGKERFAGGVAPWLVYLIPLWGIVQFLAHTTASTIETREAVLRWGALACVARGPAILVERSRGRHSLRIGNWVDFARGYGALHNRVAGNSGDWLEKAEFAADDGIPFLLLVLIPFAAAIPTALRHPWGLGLVAVMLHACLDYPFPRPAVSGWMFLLLGLLYMTRTWEREEQMRVEPSISDGASGAGTA